MTTNCNPDFVPEETPLISLDNLDQWLVHTNMTMQDEEKSFLLCDSNPVANQLIFLQRVSFETLEPLCKKLEGWLEVPMDEAEFVALLDRWTRLLGEVNEDKYWSKNYLSVWIGQITGKDGNVYDSNTGEHVPGGEIPRLKVKGTKDICTAIYKNYSHVTSCHLADPMGICSLSPEHKLTLKGISEARRKHFDTHFYFHGLKNGKPMLRYVLTCVRVRQYV